MPDPDDIALEQGLQKQFRLMTLDQYPDGGAQPEPVKSEGAPTVKFPEGVDFFVRLDRVLSENPLLEDAPVADTFKSIGIGSGGVEKLTDNEKAALEAAYKDAFNVVFDAAKNTGTPVNGWNWEFKAGRYGTDYLLRAAVNMNSVGLNSPERAMYPKRYVDSQGQPLHGKHSYTLTMPADVPVRTENGGFWSITMYDAKDRFMVGNEINRYKIGSVTEGLKRNDDGTLTIYVSHAKPTDPTHLANWLPAPDDYFMLQARLYEPRSPSSRASSSCRRWTVSKSLSKTTGSQFRNLNSPFAAPCVRTSFAGRSPKPRARGVASDGKKSSQCSTRTLADDLPLLKGKCHESVSLLAACSLLALALLSVPVQADP